MIREEERCATTTNLELVRLQLERVVAEGYGGGATGMSGWAAMISTAED